MRIHMRSLSELAALVLRRCSERFWPARDAKRSYERSTKFSGFLFLATVMVMVTVLNGDGDGDGDGDAGGALAVCVELGRDVAPGAEDHPRPEVVGPPPPVAVAVGSGVIFISPCSLGIENHGRYMQGCM